MFLYILNFNGPYNKFTGPRNPSSLFKIQNGSTAKEVLGTAGVGGFVTSVRKLAHFTVKLDHTNEGSKYNLCVWQFNSCYVANRLLLELQTHHADSLNSIHNKTRLHRCVYKQCLWFHRSIVVTYFPNCMGGICFTEKADTCLQLSAPLISAWCSCWKEEANLWNSRLITLFENGALRGKFQRHIDDTIIRLRRNHQDHHQILLH